MHTPRSKIRRALLSALVFAVPCTGAAGQCESQMLSAADGELGDELGASISISGDRLVVGAPEEGDRGAAYVFLRNGTTWAEEAKLVASGGEVDDLFGFAVSMDGDVLAVGARGDDDQGTDAGAVYLFERSGTSWSQVAKVTAGDGAAGDEFGISLGLRGGTLLVGAFRGDGVAADTGSAYVFVGSGATWIEKAELFACDGAALDGFGRSVSIDGDTALVGALFAGPAGPSSGAAYVYVRSGTSWNEQQKLTSADLAAGDLFGASVAIDGDRALLGAPLDDDDGTSSGAGYLFERSGTSWTEVAKLRTADAAAGDRLGSSVALDGDVLAASAPLSDDQGLYSGSVHAFVPCGGGWSERKLLACVGSTEDNFGFSVAVGGTTVVGGAPRAEPGGIERGAVYVHALEFGSEPGCAFCLCSLGTCGNPDPGAGCANSTGAGARLRAQGTALPDTIDLLVAGAPPGQFAIFFQGDDAAALPFGDGRLCAAGNIVRILPPLMIAPDGSAHYGPGFGDLPVSIVTGVVPGSGATKRYQFWYRNPGGPCGSGFNLSNGYEITW